LPSPTSPIHAGVVRGYRRFAEAVWVLMALGGTLALIGWATDIPILAKLWPAAPVMKANAAIGFLLASAALGLHLWNRPGTFVLSTLVMLIGLGALFQVATGLDLGIDNLFDDPTARVAGRKPGRMSQLTAIGLMLLGLRGMVASVASLAWLRDPLAVLMLAIAMTAMASLGFPLAGGKIATLPFYPVPLASATLLFLAALAWMAIEPTRGLTRVSAADSIGGALARRLLLPTLLLPLAIICLAQLLQRHLGISDDLMLTLSALLTGGAVAGLTWWVANLLDSTECARDEARWQHESARTDGLTGLPNRRALDEALSSLLDGQRGADRRLCVLMLDLDHFKHYNDTHGHAAGDEALRTAARLLRQAVRPADLPARYGGEEFVVLLPGSGAAEGVQVAERILRLFRAEVWPLRKVTVSIGVAATHSGEAAEGLLGRADAALYEAKHAGRNRAVLTSAVSAN
jgi:diguanylate cyclase (GGDEF)-like protein